MRQVFKKYKKNFLDIFLLMVPLETLSTYPDNDISHWLREDVHLINDRVFREQLSV